MSDYVTPPNVILAADTTDMQSGMLSSLENGITKGIPAAVMSGALSIYNTFLDYGGKETVDIADTIRNHDEGIGQFYLQNKDVVDTAGFIGTSLIPGSLGTKGLKLLQAGKAEGIFARATGFAASRKDAALARAIGQMAETGGTVTTDIIASRRAQLLWSVADNALMAGAGELAIALTMNDSPIFENATIGDFVKNMAIGAAFGGVIGGVFDNLAARGVLKDAQKKIEKQFRTADTIFDPAALNLHKADEIMTILDQVIYRPETDLSLPFAYRVPGSKLYNQTELDIGRPLTAARNRAEQVAMDEVAIKFNELAGQAYTGQALHGFIAKTIKQGREAGDSAEAISETVRGYIQNIKKVDALTPEAAETFNHPEQFFINKNPTSLEDLYSSLRGKNTGKQAFYLATDDASKIKTTTVADGKYKTAKDAFADGYDMFYTSSGRMAVNPKSEWVKRTPDAALDARFFVDIETGKLSRDVILTGADMLKKDSDFVRLTDEVVIAGKRFKQPASKGVSLDQTPLEISARYMWAKDLDLRAFQGRTIEWNDFPLLDKMREAGPTALGGEKAPQIRMADGALVSYNELVSPVRAINELKMQWLVQEADKLAKADGSPAGRDIRLWANELNVPRSWVEEAIDSGFNHTKKLLDTVQPLDTYFKPKTIMMEWDNSLPQVRQFMGPMGPGHMATAILSDKYRLQTALNVQQNAFAAVFGEDAKKFAVAGADFAKAATSQGAGARQFTSANADYGAKAELWAQETGKNVALLQRKLRDTDIEAMMGNISAIRNNKEAGAELAVLTTAMRRDARRYYVVLDDAGTGTPTRRLVDSEAVKLFEKGEMDLDEAIDAIKMAASDGAVIRGEYKVASPEVFDFLETHTNINAARMTKLGTLMSAAGQPVNRDLRAVYVPPIDTARYPYHAFVVAKEKIGAATDVSMITARSDEQLRKLAADVGEDYEVIYKSDQKRYFKSKDQYDYNMALNDSRVNSSLERKGKLSDFYPETRGENILEDFVRFHANASDHLVRTGVQVNSRQFFSEIQWLSQRFKDATESTFGGRGFLLKKNAEDPFGDYIKTALNLSKRNEYPVLESLNEFVDKVGTEAYSAIDKAAQSFRGSAGKDMISLDQANQLIDRYGLGTPYKTMENYITANERVPRNLIREAFQKANLFLATGVLRLDLANSLVNMISTPIMLGTELSSIRSAIGNDADLAGKLRELQYVKVPGRDTAVPSNTRLIGNAISNFFGDNKAALLKRYRDNGDIKDTLDLYHEVLGDLKYLPNQSAGQWSARVNAAVEKGAKITGNNFAEEFTRFASADVMRQLTEPLVQAGKMDLREANAYISSFVNRVQGNYISSQRPILFQGTTGAAIGLFQTYSFNVLQQLFRHVENRDTRTLMTFAGLQTSVYGMNGLPFFDAINQHLVGNAAGNRGHIDAYSILPAANKELGDWLLYGTASAFPLFGDKMPALYSRGDINPRHITIVPVNPVDIPAIGASIKVVDAVMGLAKNVGNGADLTDSFLFALEHHGINRPLAGFAQTLAGRSTTGQGSLVSAANDLQTTSMLAAIPERMISFGGIARLAGAKPMDEAVALNNMYRNKAYEAIDRAKIQQLGMAVKTKLYNNEMPSEDEMQGFMASYVRSGGRIENFSSSLQHWSKDANQSVVNQMAEQLRKPSAQRMQMQLGGTPLTDYSNLPTGE